MIHSNPASHNCYNIILAVMIPGASHPKRSNSLATSDRRVLFVIIKSGSVKISKNDVFKVLKVF